MTAAVVPIPADLADLLAMLVNIRDRPLPAELANHAKARLAIAVRDAGALRLIPAGDGRFDTAAGPWEPRARAGADALALAALNPRRWMPLGATRSRRAWGAAIARARTSLAAADPALAAMLKPATNDQTQGLRLRLRAGLVEVRWCPPHGVAIEAASRDLAVPF